MASLPTKPFATSSQVALILPNLMNGLPDFDDLNTVIKKTAVDQYLLWISNQLEIQFQQAGYIIPFAVRAGEAWPEHQNYYLELVTAMGAAALTGGHVLKPAPALSPGRGNSSGNIYQDMYNLELKKIWDPMSKSTTIRFRADTYIDTPAEKSIYEPYGPSLDYIVGKMNPEDFLLFEDYTQLRKNISDYVTSTYDGIAPLDWTDFHGLVSNKLAGYSYR